MKAILTAILILFTSTLFAQESDAAFEAGTRKELQEMKQLKMQGLKNNDTLYVPVGIKYIKIGDKVYKIVTTLEEVQPVNNFLSDRSLIYYGGVNGFLLDPK